MPAGIQIFNADGSLQFDTTNRIFRVLTVQDVGSTNTGSVTVTNNSGSVNVVAQPLSDTGTDPAVTVSGSTVSWDYNGAATRRPHELLIMEF